MEYGAQRNSQFVLHLDEMDLRTYVCRKANETTLGGQKYEACVCSEYVGSCKEFFAATTKPNHKRAPIRQSYDGTLYLCVAILLQF